MFSYYSEFDAFPKRSRPIIKTSDGDSAYVTFNRRSKSKDGHFVKYAKSLSRNDFYAAPTRHNR